MTSNILIQRNNYETKYPRLKIVFIYYKLISLIYVTIEVIFCFTYLLLLIFYSLIFILNT